MWSRVYAPGVPASIPNAAKSASACCRQPGAGHLDIAVFGGNRPRMPLADPLKAQVHLDLHRLALQVVAAQIVDVFANARTGQMWARRAGVDVGTAPTRRRGRGGAHGPSRNDDRPLG